jgi:hypothetical protein
MQVSSVVKLQDTHGIDEQQQEDDDDGLLLLPAHLSDSLQNLLIRDCLDLIMTVQNRGARGEGLQFMHSLKTMAINKCPKLLSAYKASDLCPFPSSLQFLILDFPMEGMDRLVGLQKVCFYGVGEDLRCEGVWPLLTQGQLTTLGVHDCPNFFAGWGWDPAQALQGGQEQPSSKLHELETDDIAGVLSAPICRLLTSSLTKLSFENNNAVERFTKEQVEALSLLTSLQELRFRWCEELRCLPSGLHKLTSLKRLQVDGCPAIRSLPKNGLPSSLQELVVERCNKLRCLPTGLHKLTNLKRLQIESCPAIRSLPKNGLPNSLQELDVSDCDNEELYQRCTLLVGTIPLIKL